MGGWKAAEESSTDVEGMRTMIKVKNKELRHIKKLAQVRCESNQ